MNKIKLTTFSIVILLFCNYLCFSQPKNPYLDLLTQVDITNKTFQKNFNPLPGKHDPTIIKNCFIEILDNLRLQLYGTKPLVNLPMLDSVAWMQAEFQATYDKLTAINFAPLQYTSQRLKQYGFTVQGTEFVSKAKTQQGDNDYSYFDLCIELIKPLLKTVSGTPAILLPQYTIYGFACGIDKNMRSVYISLVMGNDLTVQVFNSVGSKQKDLPITRGLTGLQFYDEAICKKCAEDPSLEQIYDMLYWDENGNVFLQSDDAKWVKKILTKAGTAIVLDFIQKEQYNCRVPQVDHNKPFRGMVSKPLSMEKIFAANDSTPKSNWFHAKIGAIPPQIELNKDIDINILLLNGKKNVCRTLIKKNVNQIINSDAKTDSLILTQNFEEALYQLTPLLSDSTVSESLLFSIVQLAAHKEKTYLSSIFTDAVKLALTRNPQRLCKTLKEFSVSVFDNKEVKKIYCNNCR
jgi:hypothetical protein